jgi:uroporphyrinogen-III synthase
MNGPLAGTRVLLTRPARTDDAIETLLRGAGASVSSMPLIELAQAPDAGALRAGAEAADRADWIVFTSAAGVEAFARNRRSRLGERTRIAAIGPATARAVVRLLERDADLVPAQFVAEELADAITARATRARIAIFAAQEARPVLAERLRAAGHSVETIVAYATHAVTPTDFTQRIAAADVIVLTSGSAARSLHNGLRRGPGLNALHGKRVVCIGAATAEEARRLEIDVAAVAREATPLGLLEVLAGS